MNGKNKGLKRYPALAAVDSEYRNLDIPTPGETPFFRGRRAVREAAEKAFEAMEPEQIENLEKLTDMAEEEMSGFEKRKNRIGTWSSILSGGTVFGILYKILPVLEPVRELVYSELSKIGEFSDSFVDFSTRGAEAAIPAIIVYLFVDTAVKDIYNHFRNPKAGLFGGRCAITEYNRDTFGAVMDAVKTTLSKKYTESID